MTQTYPGAYVDVEPASLSVRVGAYLLDGTIYVVLGYLPLILLSQVSSEGSAAAVLVLAYLLPFALAITNLVFLSRSGWTLGKRALGVRVVSEDDLRPIGAGRVLLRGLVQGGLVSVTLGISNIVELVVASSDASGRRRTWHDRASRAVVVTAASLERMPPVSQPAWLSPLQREEPAAPPAAVEQVSLVPGAVEENALVEAPSAFVAPLPRQHGGVPVSSVPSAGESGPIDMVPGSNVAAPALRSVPEAVPDAGDGGMEDRTVLRSSLAGSVAAARPAWRLTAEGVVLQEISSRTLVGRAPSARPGEPSAVTVAVADDTVSKTHALIELGGSGLRLTDRGSTNGSFVTTPDGAESRCPPDVAVDVPSGSVIRLGDKEFRVLGP